MSHTAYSKSVAIHESAHAVVAHLLGLRVLSVRLDHGAKVDGVCVYLPPDLANADRVRLEALLLLSGAAVEKVMFGRVDLAGAETDLWKVRSLLANAGAEDSENGLFREAVELVRTSIWSVLAVAEELLSRNVVSGERVTAITRCAGDLRGE